jgi:hypothetical protein
MLVLPSLIIYWMKNGGLLLSLVKKKYSNDEDYQLRSPPKKMQEHGRGCLIWQLPVCYWNPKGEQRIVTL